METDSIPQKAGAACQQQACSALRAARASISTTRTDHEQDRHENGYDANPWALCREMERLLAQSLVALKHGFAWEGNSLVLTDDISKALLLQNAPIQPHEGRDGRG